MAKLIIEIDMPDAIMEVAMNKKSKEAIKEMCQIVCQREVDKINILREAFPEVWDELQERYNAPDGLIGGEVE